MSKWILVCTILSIPWLSSGQTFKFKASIDSVLTDGYHKIYLPPAITSQLNPDFSDIRLYNSRGDELPYVIAKEKPVAYKTLFREYQIVSKTIKENFGTSLVLRNESGNKINNISLLIKNTAAHKKARLSGSDDAVSWYVIEDQYLLQPVTNASETAEIKILDFPLSDYAYYKLDINDSLSAPINILKAGYYDTQRENGKYTEIPSLHFHQQDSLAIKQSYVSVSLTEAAYIDKIEVRVKNPAYYLRPARFCIEVKEKLKRGKEKNRLSPVIEVTLNANQENVFFVSGKWPKEFYLVVDNGDNPPLQIAEIKAYQLNSYLTANLDKDKGYYLQFGHKTIQAPVYDLTYFKDKIPDNIPVIYPGKPAPLTAALVDNNSNTLFTNTLFIWIIMGVVISFLAYMSYQMINETSKTRE